MIEQAPENPTLLNGRFALNHTNGRSDHSFVPRDLGLANDAFSYWKLPENCRGVLEELNHDSGKGSEFYLFEQYLPESRRRPPNALNIYYPFKQFLPRFLRHRFNAMFIRARLPSRFPGWPCESALIDYWKEWLARASALIDDSMRWRLAFWPNGYRCCVVLTHDVESRVGFDCIERMADLEETLGFRSCWNLPLGQYRIDWNRVERLRARGFEFGAHGLCHDGKLFRSRVDFERLAPIIERLAVEHGLKGFRSPSTLRSLEWISTMNFEFDSSIADTDPFEPQAGGSCSLFPYFLGPLVELPYTMPQDHTLIHLLNRNPISTWITKAMWIANLGGMILVLTHPDYIGSNRYLNLYADLLKRLQAVDSKWCALPSEVASWWRRRARAKLLVEAGEPHILGTDKDGIVPIRLEVLQQR
jgi:hypothetical protein